MPGARSSKRVIFGGKLLDVVSSGPVGAPADGVAPLYENGGADGGAVDSIVGAQGPRDIEEIVAPISTRARGQVRVYPATITRRDFQLDAVGRHRWWLIAPMARVEVACKRPDLRTSTGYLDTNSGSEPPEQCFGRWDWSRTDLRDKTTILYHAQSRSGKETSLARRIDRPGRIEPFIAPPHITLPHSRIWRIGRGTRREPECWAHIDRTLEDTPLYARSVIRTRLLTREIHLIHERLSLDPFSSVWVQAMLPFRMPRVIR
jgi:carotenoid 1,2-hydratase